MMPGRFRLAVPRRQRPIAHWTSQRGVHGLLVVPDEEIHLIRHQPLDVVGDVIGQRVPSAATNLRLHSDVPVVPQLFIDE